MCFKQAQETNLRFIKNVSYDALKHSMIGIDCPKNPDNYLLMPKTHSDSIITYPIQQPWERNPIKEMYKPACVYNKTELIEGSYLSGLLTIKKELKDILFINLDNYQMSKYYSKGESSISAHTNIFMEELVKPSNNKNSYFIYHTVLIPMREVAYYNFKHNLITEEQWYAFLDFYNKEKAQFELNFLGIKQLELPEC